MTVISKHVLENGPYAYRIHRDTSNKSGQRWVYLGKTRALDPRNPKNGDPLTFEEQNKLRNDGFEFADQQRINSTAEFAKRAAANDMRDTLTERWGNAVLDETDDRRTASVQLHPDAPESAEALAMDIAAEDRSDAQGFGQTPLTRAERKRIDFTKDGQNVFHARSAKAAIQAAGYSDWTALYTHDIEDAAGFHKKAEQEIESGSSGGQLLDEREQNRNPATGAEQADSQMQIRAEEGLKEGFDEPETILRNEYGYTDADIERVKNEAPRP